MTTASVRSPYAAGRLAPGAGAGEAFARPHMPPSGGESIGGLDRVVPDAVAAWWSEANTGAPLIRARTDIEFGTVPG